MNNIAIITARGGSKRIPKKNIRIFHGKPIIAYSIEAALKSSLFQDVIVSTDSLEIAETAKAYGASVPFLRSSKNSDDYATSVDVVIEVLENCEKMGKYFDYGCCIYPTAPFVEAKDLQDAYRQMEKAGADSCVSVTKFSFPPQRAYTIQDGCLRLVYPENLNKRSQDLEPMYHDAGQFYFFKSCGVIREKRFTLQSNVPYIMDNLKAQDIDNEEDWKLAEVKYSLLKEMNKG